MDVINLQITVIEESLAILCTPATDVVIGHRECRVIRITHPEDRPVLAVVGDAPETSLGRDESLVAVVIVGKSFGRLGEVNLVGRGGNEVFGLFAVRGSLSKRRVGLEIGETAAGGVVEEVAAEVVGTEAESRVLVDRDGRIRVRFAAHRRVAGGGTRGVLVQVVRLVGRGLGFALLVIGRRRTAVANRVVVEVLGEARDGLAVLRSAGRSQFAARIV